MALSRSGSDGDAAFESPAAEAVFQSYPAEMRQKLLALRRLIFETASATPGVGPLEETLKWGQPSYLTARSGSGTTIRIDQVRGDATRCGVYFSCQTDLAETFRALYPDELELSGNRGILLDVAGEIPEGPLRHCIALILTYHLGKRGQQATPPAQIQPRRLK